MRPSIDDFTIESTLAFPSELIVGPNETPRRQFDVVRTRKPYGKDVCGSGRSTFVIDANATLAKQWRDTKVPGHADEVLAVAQSVKREG